MYGSDIVMGKSSFTAGVFSFRFKSFRRVYDVTFGNPNCFDIFEALLRIFNRALFAISFDYVQPSGIPGLTGLKHPRALFK